MIRQWQEFFYDARYDPPTPIFSPEFTKMRADVISRLCRGQSRGCEGVLEEVRSSLSDQRHRALYL